MLLATHVTAFPSSSWAGRKRHTLSSVSPVEFGAEEHFTPVHVTMAEGYTPVTVHTKVKNWDSTV